MPPGPTLWLPPPTALVPLAQRWKPTAPIRPAEAKKREREEAVGPATARPTPQDCIRLALAGTGAKAYCACEPPKQWVLGARCPDCCQYAFEERNNAPSRAESGSLLQACLEGATVG